jgi:hypothetical protein
LPFSTGVCLITGIVFGLAPALHISKTNLNEVLKEGGRSGSGGVRARRWTAGLIVAELTLTLVLLAGAGFMMRKLAGANGADDPVTLASITLLLAGVGVTACLLPARQATRLNPVQALLNRLQASGALGFGLCQSLKPETRSPKPNSTCHNRSS